MDVDEDLSYLMSNATTEEDTTSSGIKTDHRYRFVLDKDQTVIFEADVEGADSNGNILLKNIYIIKGNPYNIISEEIINGRTTGGVYVLSSHNYYDVSDLGRTDTEDSMEYGGRKSKRKSRKSKRSKKSKRKSRKSKRKSRKGKRKTRK